MAFLHPEEDKLFEPSMALPVTRHALIPFQGGFSFLLCGIDSLDLGGFVDWRSSWREIQGNLQRHKECATKSNGEVLCNAPVDRLFLFMASGKPPQYRYHLRFAEYHLYIGITNPPEETPNVYISFNAETLWNHGLKKCLELASRDIRLLGGELLYLQVSRVDLSTDFHIPGDLSLTFLDRHKVSRSRDQQHYLSKGHLETYYIGTPGAPIRLRIYDKGTEIAKTNKQWLLNLWGIERPECVWRVEFQLRRSALKEMGIETSDCLKSKLGGVWRYLTEEWFSLRLPDHERQDRREVHPWWAEVQALASKFGPAIDLQRLPDSELPAPLEWYIAHIGGCLPSIGALTHTVHFDFVLNELFTQLIAYWFDRDFKGEVQKRMLRLGKQPPAKGGEHEKEW
jgi:hypothetical protein